MIPAIIGTLVAFAVFALMSAKFRLYEKEYIPEKKSHNALIFIVTGACAVLSYIIFTLLFEKGMAYPFEKGLEYCSPYEELFDALMKHQLNIDVVPDAKLAEMTNPYDWEAREYWQVSYLWDRAYYNGSYFCYFGPAPVLLVYFPYYFITKTVPSPQTVCFIIAILTVPVIAALTVKAQKLFLRRTNLVLLLLSVLTVEAGSLVFMVQSSADFYYTAVQSGILFLAVFLLTTLCAYEKKTAKAKSVYFAISGAALVFLVLSRPNMALFAVTAVPVYLNVLLSKNFAVKEKAAQVLSFLIPSGIGAAFVMWYNYARFGSVFEFGAAYQLTVHDVHDYSLSLAMLWPTVYYYFAKQPQYLSHKPFIDFEFVNLFRGTGYGKYVYLTSTVGALSMPCNWAALTAGPLMAGEKNRVKQGFVIVGAVCVFAVAYVDMCLAGVNIRYLADIMLVLTLLSVLMLIDLFSGISENKKVRLVCFLLVSLILILSAAVGFLLILNNERAYILKLMTEN